MTQQITIFGYGATGRSIAERLAARGDRVRIATRTRPADLPAGVEHQVCDVLDLAEVRRALDGSAQAVWRSASPTTRGFGRRSGRGRCTP